MSELHCRPCPNLACIQIYTGLQHLFIKLIICGPQLFLKTVQPFCKWKVDREGHWFQIKGKLAKFFSEIGYSCVCLMGQQTVAVFKEFSITTRLSPTSQNSSFAINCIFNLLMLRYIGRATPNQVVKCTFSIQWSHWSVATRYNPMYYKEEVWCEMSQLYSDFLNR